MADSPIGTPPTSWTRRASGATVLFLALEQFDDGVVARAFRGDDPSTTQTRPGVARKIHRANTEQDQP
jgi:hypothetical protein